MMNQILTSTLGLCEKYRPRLSQYPILYIVAFPLCVLSRLAVCFSPRHSLQSSGTQVQSVKYTCSERRFFIHLTLHCRTFSHERFVRQSSLGSAIFFPSAMFRSKDLRQAVQFWNTSRIVLPEEGLQTETLQKKKRTLSSQVKIVEQIARARKFCNIVQIIVQSSLREWWLGNWTNEGFFSWIFTWLC